MTTADEANSILSTVDTAARQVRVTRPTRAVPLLVLGLVIVGAMPFYVLAEPTSQEGAQPNQLFWSLGGMIGTRAGAWTGIYWMIALPVAYGFIAWWYRRAAQRNGVAVNVKPLVITGVALFALLLVMLAHPPTFVPGDIIIRGLTPILTTAVGLIVWAAAERSAGLLTVGVAFLAVAISASLYDFGNLVSSIAFEYSMLPNLILCAVVLLVSSAIYAVVERRERTQA